MAKLYHARRGSLPAHFEAEPCCTPAGAGHPVKAIKDTTSHLLGRRGQQPANAREGWSSDGQEAMGRTAHVTNHGSGHNTTVSFYACRAAGPALTRAFSDLARDTLLTSDTTATGICLGHDFRAFDNNYSNLNSAGSRPGRVTCRRAFMGVTGRI